MRFIPLLSISATLLPIFQALAYPSIEPVLAAVELSDGKATRAPMLPREMPLNDVITGAQSNLWAITRRVGKIKAKSPNSTQEIKAAASEVKLTYNEFIQHLESLATKTSQTAGQPMSKRLETRSLETIQDIYQLFKDYAFLASEIHSIASASSVGDVFSGVGDMLATIVKGTPTAISVAMKLLSSSC